MGATGDEGLLDRLEGLLRDRGIQAGLIAEGERAALRGRHIEDSLRVSEILREGDRLVCDIGSGAGLPGMPLAISFPDRRFVLIEPRRRAVAFLELAVDELGLRNVEILASRVEDVDLQVDLATARAFGPLQRSWEAAVGVLRPGGRLVYFAGAGLEDPGGAAERLTQPEPPAAVEVHVIASSSPLVIMERRT